MLGSILYIIIALYEFYHCSGAVNNVDVTRHRHDLKECSGPIYYYEELGCKPVYDKRTSKCPIRYNCDMWKNVPDNKCLINGKFYNFGDKLRPEDQNIGDDCVCIGGLTGWLCAHQTDERVCHQTSMNFGHESAWKYCYQKDSPFQKCAGPTVCVDKKSDQPICIVNGIKYKDGEYFVPSEEPEKFCVCGEGYNGKNVKPYCASPKHTWCDNILDRVTGIRSNCAPVYFKQDRLYDDCNQEFICQTDKDIVNKGMAQGNVDPDMTCKFGNLTLNIGDDLIPHSIDTFIKCTCQVPPVPTCFLLDSEIAEIDRYNDDYDYEYHLEFEEPWDQLNDD